MDVQTAIPQEPIDDVVGTHELAAKAKRDGENQFVVPEEVVNDVSTP